MADLRQVRFESAALDGAICEVKDLEGEDELNRLFSFTVTLLVPGGTPAQGLAGELLLLLRGRYPARELVVQYGESDFDFISRLCEDLGIVFFFRLPRDCPDLLNQVCHPVGFVTSCGASRLSADATGPWSPAASRPPSGRPVRSFRRRGHRGGRGGRRRPLQI